MSSPKYDRVIFLFRRDLRLPDNSGLNHALRDGRQVLPLFILDPALYRTDSGRHPAAQAFLRDSLLELDVALKEAGAAGLQVSRGEPKTVLAKCLQRHQAQAVMVNRDYSPYSRRRDDALQKMCQRQGADWITCADQLLLEPEDGLKADGTPYRVFTPFYRKNAAVPISVPAPLKRGGWLPPADGQELGSCQALMAKTSAAIRGGRQEAVQLLERLSELHLYASQRDQPAESGTSRLSAHLKFGTCSVREFYYQVVERLGEEHPLLRQLYWRDFFTHIGVHSPHVFNQPFDPRFRMIGWRNNEREFTAWREGRTGYPLVDAGMRELSETGYMHNRVRMVTASFLVKDLQVDWRLGERHFARLLVDFDPCVNNGNWQWAAGTGCDAQPWFRIFNPWLQQRKFDPAAIYIKRWVPELAGLDARSIQRLDRDSPPTGYVRPVVDHAIRVADTKARFKQALASAG